MTVDQTPLPRQLALISVSDKTGLEDLARALDALGIDLMASGGTARAIKALNLPVIPVEAATQFPEMLGGRVKTLHPAVHAGILARGTPEDNAELARAGIRPISHVICNLYPFEAAISKFDTTWAQATEEVDIGGVTLLRAAAKNHERVTVVSEPGDYTQFVAELTATRQIARETRRKLAVRAFQQTAAYDRAISRYFAERFANPAAFLPLRYGCNPHQSPAFASMPDHRAPELPFTVLGGTPGYVNLLDALNAWPLVTELAQATGLPAAASFKHVSPAGVAVGLPLDQTLRAVCQVDPDDKLSPLAAAYARARGADRMSSFGDWVALSHVCDASTAKLIAREVSDGVIAPGYTKEALGLLLPKKGFRYSILQMDPKYAPAPDALESREVFGVTLTQRRNSYAVSAAMFGKSVDGQPCSETAVRDLIVATVALKYTQSNSVCLARDGMVIGLGAGQQSRIHCTRLACGKADAFLLRHHPAVLSLRFRSAVKRAVRATAIDQFVTDSIDDPVAFAALFEDGAAPTPLTPAEREAYLAAQTGAVCGSDAFFPFPDNIDRLAKSGVTVVAAPGGSVLDGAVAAAARRHDMALVFTNTRLFHH